MKLFSALRNAVKWAGFDLDRPDGAAAQAVVIIDPATGLPTSPSNVTLSGPITIANEVEIKNEAGNAVPVTVVGEVEIKNDFSTPLPVQTTNGLTEQQLRSAPVDVMAANITTKFRDAFETYAEGVNWVSQLQDGDLLMIDGNTASASYLVLSKNPLSANGTSSLTSVSSFAMPVELSFGLHMSQRALGQELAVELASDETPLDPVADIAIASISQATTTLTVNTQQPHNLVPGVRIGICDNSDSRFNYPALVVATTPSPTQITVTAGPGGTIPSITGSGGNNGFITLRSSMGYARNGMSQIFENASVVNSSLYVRSNSGDAIQSGTPAGIHSLTTATTASVQAVISAYSRSFQPSTEFRFGLQADRAQFFDGPVDSAVVATSRLIRTQVVPDSSKSYKLRFRFTNNKSLSVPVARIVSISKSGSTTATVITDKPHKLTTTDYVLIYGVRDQANFANVTAQTVVASVIDAYRFTLVLGSAVTATSYGGTVIRSNGSNAAAGFLAPVVQSASVANNELTLVGNTTWTPLIGDLVNLHGCRDAASGADMGLDGVYRVASIVTTTMVLQPLGNTTLPASLASTNCGGAVIKRTDARISFVRVFDYKRQRVEMLPRPDGAAGISVNVLNVPSVAVSGGTVTTVSTVTAANLNAPQIIADVASAALTASATVAAITPTYGNCYEVNIPVAAMSGTTPTLDVSIEESDDTGGSWYKVYDFPRITATGMYRSPKIPMTGNRIRYVQTVGGSSPSFTRAINRLQASDTPLPIRQMIDRTVVLTTLGSATPSLNIQNCRNLQLIVNIGAAATPPQLQLEGSEDNGQSWYPIGLPLAAVASSSVQVIVSNVSATLARARVSTAGAAVTAGYVLVKGF